MKKNSIQFLIEAIERARIKIEAESWDDYVKLIRINKLLDCVIEELEELEDDHTRSS